MIPARLFTRVLAYASSVSLHKIRWYLPTLEYHDTEQRLILAGTDYGRIKSPPVGAPSEKTVSWAAVESSHFLTRYAKNVSSFLRQIPLIRMMDGKLNPTSQRSRLNLETTIAPFLTSS